MARLRTLALIPAALALAAFAAPATAATLAVEDGQLLYQAEGSEFADVEVYDGPVAGTKQVVDWAGAVTVPGSGCVPTGPDAIGGSLSNSFICDGVDRIRLEGGNDFDYLYVSGDAPAELIGNGGGDYLYGGAGDDLIDGGDGPDQLAGGEGADRVVGGAGNDRMAGDYREQLVEYEDGPGDPTDAPEPEPAPEPGQEEPPPSELEPEPELPGGPDVLEGGPGDDRMQGGAGTDTLRGGEGSDLAQYAGALPVTATLDGIANDGRAGENDAISEIEGFSSFAGADQVAGDAGPNLLVTNGGNDVVNPGGGADAVFAGSGEDLVDARDGVTDTIACGRDKDRVIADAIDAVDATCEVVERPGGTAAGAGSTPAAVAITPTGIATTVRRKGARVRVVGRVVLPAGADPRTCLGGKVLLRATGLRGAKPATAIADEQCRFTATLRGRAPKRGRVTVRATFGGTPRVEPFSAPVARMR